MRKFIKLTLYMSQLMDDVRTKTYFVGKNNGADEEHIAYIQENNDAINEDTILRSFQNAISSASAIISEYAPIELELSSDALIVSTNDIILVVSLPMNFNEGMTNTLASILHKYLVDTALFDWFTEVAPSLAKPYDDATALDEVYLREALTRRLRPARSEIVPDIVPYSGSGTYVEKTTATLTFAKESGSTGIASTFTNVATTNSDGTIKYYSSDVSIATVDSNGVVTGVGGGTATITAVVDETDTYTPASASYEVTVERLRTTLAFPDDITTSLYIGGEVTNSATTNSDGTITYSISDTDIATISSDNGHVVAKAVGEAVVTATVPETSTHVEATATYTLSVIQPPR